jgi:NitT/TauT family transport system substrate-binding protein
MKVNRRKIVPAVLAAWVCLLGSVPSVHGAATAVQVLLDWKPEPEFGGFYQGQIGGDFARANLDVTLKSAGEGAPTWQLLATGKCDFATTAADQVLIARGHDADIVAVFAVYQTFPQGIMVHKARGFKSIQDVFASAGTLAAEDDTWLHFLMKKYPNPKVQIVSYAGGIGPFLAKADYSQQCFVTSEPILAGNKGGDPQTFLIADAGYNPYTTVLITRAQTIKQNPKLVASMVAACRAGWRSYLDDPAAANAAMGKLNTDMDAATFTAAAAAQKPFIDTDPAHPAALGTMTHDRWDQLARELVDLKVLDKAPDINPCFANP